MLSRSRAPLTSKRIRLNGVARRATEVVGQIASVLFTTLDIEIITGSPSQRRRYLDLTIAQSDRDYAGAYGRYEKALAQRNALLKRIRDGTGFQRRCEELIPWDDVIAEEGGVVMEARTAAVAALNRSAAAHHRTLTPPEEDRQTLSLSYLPALEEEVPGILGSDSPAGGTAGALRAAMVRLRRREIAAGTTLVGPHRDDMAVRLGGRSAAAYGSRAQLRSAALAMRLAEADRLWAQTGERPLLLLDDVLSELDPARREVTVSAFSSAEQVLLTTADASSIPHGLRPDAAYRLAEGQLVASTAS